MRKYGKFVTTNWQVRDNKLILAPEYGQIATLNIIFTSQTVITQIINLH